MKKHELLAPAGSYEIAKAVIEAGADAVYLGGDRFGARALAANLDQQQILQILDHAHLRNCRLNLTVNTLLKNKEIEEQLYEYLLPFYEAGLDAVIVQDFGVVRFISRNFPGMAVHASTQMSVSSADGAAFLKKYGVERVVTARELSLEEIRDIYDRTGMEIESFIHGALCYCYSGQCLMSSLIGGRSGNRGRCAQPCRLPYRVVREAGQGTEPLTEKEWYPLSPKDLCTVDLLPELSAAGIFSFKIEGRMKQLEYAAGVTGVYRKYIDRLEADPKHYRVEEEDRRLLMDLGNRSGFTDGYYRRHNGPEMLADRNSSHQSAKTAGMAAEGRRKVPVSVYCRAAAGEPLLLSISAEDASVTAEGTVVLEAMKRPMKEEDLKKQICKTGGTSYEIEQFTGDIGENCFLPVKSVNELRRQAFEELDAVRLAPYRRKQPADGPAFYRADDEDRKISAGQACGTEGPETSAGQNDGDEVPVINSGQTGGAEMQTVISIADPAQLDIVLASGLADRVDLDYPKGTPEEILRRDLDRIRLAGSKAGYCFPYVLRKSDGYAAGGGPEMAVRLDFDYYIARSFDSLGWLLDQARIAPDRVITDYNVYVFSREAAAAYADTGLAGYTVSYELNQKEMMHQQKRGAELLVYGYQPLMISAQCVYRNYDVCSKNGGSRQDLFLEDRYQNRFRVMCDCGTCYNVIWNAVPLSLLDAAEAVGKLPFQTRKLSFTSETPRETKQILGDYRKAFLTGESLPKDREADRKDRQTGRNDRQSDRKDRQSVRKDRRITHGHFNRGVE